MLTVSGGGGSSNSGQECVWIWVKGTGTLNGQVKGTVWDPVQRLSYCLVTLVKAVK